MQHKSGHTLFRLLAMAAAGALAAGCATVPGDPYYYDGGYSGYSYSGYSQPYSYYPGASTVTLYDQPTVVYTAPPPGWRADAWREHQRREARERDMRREAERRDRDRDRREADRQREAARRDADRRRDAERRDWDRRQDQQQAERDRRERAERAQPRPLTNLEREALERGVQPGWRR